MQQWVAEIAYETPSGPKKVSESFYLPSVDDVRVAVTKKGGFVLSIRPHARSPLERLLARSTWWQVQLLRGIQFRSTSTSPGVALWKIIQAETNPRRQNIMAPAREALARGLGVIDALKALNTFDHGTLAILAGSERANRLVEGIPHAIHSITQKKKNAAAIMGTMGWLAFDVFSIVSSLWAGKDMVLGWFRDNTPTDPEELEKFLTVVGRLELTWDVLIFTSVGFGAFMAWCVFSYWINRGKRDFPTARIVRKIPLIGGYLRDLAFADSMSAAARMLRGLVPINDTLDQSSEASSAPDVTEYWKESLKDLGRGVSLGAALDRAPLTRSERLEVAGLSDLGQVATVMESIAEMRSQAARTKHKLIVWIAFLLTGIFLAIAFGSAIYALTVMNMSMDSMMGGLMEGAI
ncbi:MAG TPA: type II secretion system protein [Alphaproteobacteria bacterium]|nr:MAG: type II secretion system F family protein [Rhodospirillales bacterium]HOO81872.1 type II secretion system protein [Alphaproteobacteria bacterium]